MRVNLYNSVFYSTFAVALVFREPKSKPKGRPENARGKAKAMGRQQGSKWATTEQQQGNKWGAAGGQREDNEKARQPQGSTLPRAEEKRRKNRTYYIAIIL